MKNIIRLCNVLIIIVSLQFIGCKKFLDEKTDKKLVVPQTLADAQALLDFFALMNTAFPYTPNFSDDNYYFRETYFNSLNTNLKNMHTWQQDIVNDNEWTKFYGTIVTANLALETLDKNPVTTYNESQWKNIKGAAHFFRALSFFHLIQLYTQPYEAATASTLPGISLRLSTNANIPSTRAGLQESWQQVINDYKMAAQYLPVTVPLPNRPARSAAFAGLSIAYMHIQQFQNAALAADSSLKLYSDLLNYNTLNAAAVNPFQQFNKEVIFHAQSTGVAGLAVANHCIDSLLYNSYHPNDLRRSLFFKSNGTGTVGFRGSYNGNTTQTTLFVGLTTAEVFLLRAEANVRLGLKDSAMNDLNRLLVTRYKINLFIPLSATTNTEALNIILTERRKEMVMRGSRWFDLRRLNTNPAQQKTLQRKFSTASFELLPNSKRYTFFIPQQVINISGMLQNNR